MSTSSLHGRDNPSRWREYSANQEMIASREPMLVMGVREVVVVVVASEMGL